MLTKQCYRCKNEQPLDKFFKREDRPGFYAWCKSCMKEGARTPDYPPLKERGHGQANPRPRDL